MIKIQISYTHTHSHTHTHTLTHTLKYRPNREHLHCTQLEFVYQETWILCFDNEFYLHNEVHPQTWVVNITPTLLADCVPGVGNHLSYSLSHEVGGRGPFHTTVNCPLSHEVGGRGPFHTQVNCL